MPDTASATALDRQLTDNTQLPAMVAVEVVLLRPRNPSRTGAGEPGLWPVFAIVLGEPADPADPHRRILNHLLDRPRSADQLAVIHGDCHWIVLDADRALLKLTLQARAPVRFDLDILLPARPVLGVLDVLAHGATIGITTQRHAEHLDNLTDTRCLLRELILLDCPPPTDLAALHQTHDHQTPPHTG